jgi:hypothetical protein
MVPVGGGGWTVLRVTALLAGRFFAAFAALFFAGVFAAFFFAAFFFVAFFFFAILAAPLLCEVFAPTT